MKPDFDGATILITGGTGSFGNALLNQLLGTSVRQVRIFSRDELKQDQMRARYKDARVAFYLGDVRDRASLDGAMTGVHYVFHAAALKQVPSCEFFPLQAVQTNILGSTNVVESAKAHGVRRVVCLSTDKAVYPINAMGMTKALMEKVAVAAARAAEEGDTIFSSVRYGNVMYSRGSVIPLFIQQIKSGEALTLTVPEMTRFLLPLPHAIDLVTFAFENANQGDLFIKKAPACTVQDLALALLELFGSSVPLKVIGTRHGEKLYETLATSEELARADDMGDYYRVPMDGRDLNYGKYFVEGDVRQATLDDYHSHNTERLDLGGVKDLLLSLPELRAELQNAGRAGVIA
jgi:UDP-N-acetylglucosamine 4,6-dehydratase/5-epimerase